MADYELRANNASVRSVCPSCGDDFKPSLGLWPFAPGSWDPLCEDCWADGQDVTDPAELAATIAAMRLPPPPPRGPREF